MSDWDRALPPSDRQDEPDPMPRETALQRVRRLCRELAIRCRRTKRYANLGRKARA